MTIPICGANGTETRMPDNKPDHAGIHWRVSKSLGPDGELLRRHVFRDLSGQVVEAACEHVANADDLLPDDDRVQLCIRCRIALGADLADRLGDRRPLD